MSVPSHTTSSPIGSPQIGSPQKIDTEWAYTSILGTWGSRKKIELQRDLIGGYQVNLISQGIFDRIFDAIGLTTWTTPPKPIPLTKDLLGNIAENCHNIFQNAANADGSKILETDLHSVLEKSSDENLNQQIANAINGTVIPHFKEIVEKRTKLRSIVSNLTNIHESPDKTWKSFAEKVLSNPKLDFSTVERNFTVTKIQTSDEGDREALKTINMALGTLVLPSFSKFKNPDTEPDANIRALVEKRSETWESYKKIITQPNTPEETSKIMDILAEEEVVDDILYETLDKHHTEGFEGCREALQNEVVKQLKLLDPKIDDSMAFPEIRETVIRFQATKPAGQLEDLQCYMHCLNLFTRTEHRERT